MNKNVLVLKKSEYTTKDGKTVYRLHLWVDDGCVEYTVVNVDKTVYDLVSPMDKIDIGYDLNIFGNKIYGIKNVILV